jgi:dCMP deaminase
MDRPTWTETFFELAHVTAKRSKDQSTQLGAVIAGSGNNVVSVGYNCFPRGINDNKPSRHQRPAKYLYFEHAERNAIYNAARQVLIGTKLFIPHYPCADCARGIIQTGIKHVVIENIGVIKGWNTSCAAAEEMLKEAGIIVTYKE